MKTIKYIEGGVTAAKGFAANGIHCGIRKNKTKKDLALVFCEVPCNAAAAFTTNLVKAAPILVSSKHLADGKARAVIVNSGNANASAAGGMEASGAMCAYAAEALGVSANDVLVASTGVIGVPLPLDPIKKGIPGLVAGLSKENHTAAAEAIMTTDLTLKEYAVEFEAGGKKCVIGGMTKGSGMIHPNMATMLMFITTDMAAESNVLHKALIDAVQDTVNMLSVDGDTSTNDTVFLMSSGLAGNSDIKEGTKDYETFKSALLVLMTELTKMMAADGEGATKLITCNAKGAKSNEDAKKTAKAVIGSSLVKSAVFGHDANWGRIACAAGYSGADFDPYKMDITMSSETGTVEVCKGGLGLDFSEEAAKAVFEAKEIIIEVNLNEGGCTATAWGCDLTYDYVKINGDYRT